MLVKNHEIPLALLQLTALKKRLPHDHPAYKKVTNDWTKYNLGYRGELSLDYYLSRINQRDNYILHSLRLIDHRPFQMDTVILTPNFILVIEVKNYSGTIQVDHEFGTMVKNNAGEERSFQDPTIQADEQAYLLQSWLKDKGVYGIPVESLVVFVGNHVQLTRKNGHSIDPRLIHAAKLNETYQQLSRKHTDPVLSQNDLKKISRMMVEENKPLPFDIWERYNISTNDIQTGVRCPSCEKLGMKRDYGKWVCLSCQTTSVDAHVKALKDFRVLFGNKITNSQARWLFQIDSRKVALQLLKRENLVLTGKNKGATYQLPYDLDKEYTYLLKVESQTPLKIAK